MFKYQIWNKFYFNYLKFIFVINALYPREEYNCKSDYV